MKTNNDITEFNKYIKKKDVNINLSRDVLVYTRVSSKSQKDNNDSLSTQKTIITEFCKNNDYNIIDYFGGTYESAKGDYTRQEFTKLIDYIKRLKIKPFGIVVFMINRFSRSGPSSIGILHELVELQKVHLIEANSGLNTTTPKGYIQISEKLIDSRKENLVRQETVIPNMITFLSKGFIFGRCPIGYDHYGPRVKNEKFLRKEQRIVINDFGKELKECFQLKLSGNYSDVQIIDILKRKGYNISKQQISKTWRNPFYCGISINSLLKDGQAIEGKWEKLISIKDFQRLQKILENNPSGYKHKKQNEFKPLTGFIRCKKCNTKMVGYINKKKQLTYYKCNYCNSVSLNGDTKKHSKRIGGHDLFQNLLQSYEINPSFLKLIELQLNKIYDYYNHKEFENERSLIKKINEKEDKSNKLDIRYGLDEIPKEIYDKTKVLLTEELMILKEELNNSNPKLSNQKNMIEKSLKNLQNISKIWGSVGLNDKQKIQKTLFPLGIYYDNEKHSYLTPEINSFVLISNSISDDCEENKKRTNHFFDEKSLSVAGSGVEPETFGL